MVMVTVPPCVMDPTLHVITLFTSAHEPAVEFALTNETSADNLFVTVTAVAAVGPAFETRSV